jgi:hypothetical protein
MNIEEGEAEIYYIIQGSNPPNFKNYFLEYVGPKAQGFKVNCIDGMYVELRIED